MLDTKGKEEGEYLPVIEREAFTSVISSFSSSFFFSRVHVGCLYTTLNHRFGELDLTFLQQVSIS